MSHYFVIQRYYPGPLTISLHLISVTLYFQACFKVVSKLPLLEPGTSALSIIVAQNNKIKLPLRALKQFAPMAARLCWCSTGPLDAPKGQIISRNLERQNVSLQDYIKFP